MILGGSTAEQITWLAIEHFADSRKCGEPDRFGSTVLQHGKIYICHADVRGKLCESHTALAEEAIEMDTDSMAFSFVTRLHTTPSRSSCMRVPTRMIRAKVTSPTAVKSAR